MGNYRDAIALAEATHTTPDLNKTNTYASVKYGLGLNIEQELTDDLGVVLRVGWNDGQTETWAFTETDRTAAFGLLLKGTRWCRPQDTVGIGLVVNGSPAPMPTTWRPAASVSSLAMAGLNYEPEFAWETYYSWQ